MSRDGDRRDTRWDRGSEVIKNSLLIIHGMYYCRPYHAHSLVLYSIQHSTVHPYTHSSNTTEYPSTGISLLLPYRLGYYTVQYSTVRHHRTIVPSIRSEYTRSNVSRVVRVVRVVLYHSTDINPLDAYVMVM